MTRALRRSKWWASFREDLTRRGLEPDRTVLVDAFDDDEDVDIGLLHTEEQRLIAWRRAYSDENHAANRILEWDDITESWERSLWRETAASYLAAVQNTRDASGA
jgi:hypothetical protein